MIRADTRDIISRALALAPTSDGEPMTSHVHLLSVTDSIVRGFAAEGIDIEVVVEGIIANQTVQITNGGQP